MYCIFAGKYFLYLLEKPSFSGVQHICHYPDGEPDLYSLVRPTLIRHPPEEQSKAPSKKYDEIIYYDNSHFSYLITNICAELSKDNYDALFSVFMDP